LSQIGFSPALVIPITTGYPTPGGTFAAKSRNPLSELVRRFGVAQVHARKLKAAGHEMNMRIVETWQHEPALRIDRPGVGSAELFDLIIRPTAIMRLPRIAIASAAG
jgi:hypothetical protein